MSFGEYKRVEITDFLGPFTSLEEGDVPANRGLLAHNTQFSIGNVSKRYGYSPVFSPNEPIRSMFNWLYTDAANGPINYLLYWNGSQLRYGPNTGSVTPATAYTQAGAYAANYASIGPRVYIAHFNESGMGVGHGRVFSLTPTAWAGDALFERPRLTTEVTVSTGTATGGKMTPGTRNVAFIVTTRNGYTGRPSPTDGDLVLQPTALTTDETNNSATLTITPVGNWPDSTWSVQAIMTTVSNPAEYHFVPGATDLIPGGSTFPAVVSLNFSDEELLQATVATPYFSLLTQNDLGEAPFSPCDVFRYGNRMVYVVKGYGFDQGIFISEPNNYEAISADQHYLSFGGADITTGFQLRDTMYVVGPHWTYSVSDTGEVPALWAAPQLIDGSIGTICPKGVAVNIAQGIAWVVSTNGLYRFTGAAYDTKPISYYQSDWWQRINWGAAHTVQVVDDTVRKLVRVLVPLDGATSPNYELTWNYEVDTAPEKAKFSYYTKADSPATAIAIVQHGASKKLEAWIGTASGVVQRQNDGSEATPYRDGAASPIDFAYETAQLPGTGAGGFLYQHHGAHIRAYGSGTLTLTAYSIDKAKTFPMTALALSAAPGKLLLSRTYAIAEGCRVRFANNGLDEWANVSMLRWYYNDYATQR